MKVLIVEDELPLAERLSRLVSELLGHKLSSIKTIANFDDADDYINENTIDLLFLDLNLQNRDGFNLLKQTVADSFHTIIVSANTHRAIEAFEYGVLDFIPKPYTKDRLKDALDRYGSHESNLSQASSLKFLSIKKKDRLEMCNIEDVMYIKGANNYSEIVLNNGATELHSKSLSKLLDILPGNFERLHKSYIVPLNKVVRLESLVNANYQVVLLDGTAVPISRTKAKALKDNY